GLSSGVILKVDLASGTVLERLAVGGPVQDLALGGDYLYVLTSDRLRVVGGFDGGLQDLASVASPYISTPNRRLFVGGGIAYAVHGKGCNTFNLTNGVQPVLIAAGSTTQFGWKQLIPNGSGLAVGAVDNNFALDGPNDVSLYNVSDPANVNRFLTTFQTPGTSE